MDNLFLSDLRSLAEKPFSMTRTTDESDADVAVRLAYRKIAMSVYSVDEVTANIIGYIRAKKIRYGVTYSDTIEKIIAHIDSTI